MDSFIHIVGWNNSHEIIGPSIANKAAVTYAAMDECESCSNGTYCRTLSVNLFLYLFIFIYVNQFIFIYVNKLSKLKIYLLFKNLFIQSNDESTN